MSWVLLPKVFQPQEVLGNYRQVQPVIALICSTNDNWRTHWMTDYLCLEIWDLRMNSLYLSNIFIQ